MLMLILRVVDYGSDTITHCVDVCEKPLAMWIRNLKCIVLCLKIIPNCAVARDGRLCLGQRILEVC